MNIVFNICISLSVGLIIGFLVGGLKSLFFRRPYTEKKVNANRRLIKKVANVLKYCTIAMLLTGFIWCVYFLILALVSPDRADYANNMAELIVAVLTVISILFAFVEFLRRKD